MDSLDNEYCDDCGGTCDDIHSLRKEDSEKFMCEEAAKALIQMSKLNDELNDLRLENTVQTTIASAVNQIETLNKEVIVNNSNLSPDILERKIRNFMKKQVDIRKTIQDAIQKIPHDSLKTLYTNVFKVETMRFICIQAALATSFMRAKLAPHVDVAIFATVVYIGIRVLSFLINKMV